jgi:hypothetical protein
MVKMQEGKVRDLFLSGRDYKRGLVEIRALASGWGKEDEREEQDSLIREPITTQPRGLF